MLPLINTNTNTVAAAATAIAQQRSQAMAASQPFSPGRLRSKLKKELKKPSQPSVVESGTENHWTSSQSKVLSEKHTSPVNNVPQPEVVREVSGFGSPRMSPPASQRKTAVLPSKLYIALEPSAQTKQTRTNDDEKLSRTQMQPTPSASIHKQSSRLINLLDKTLNEVSVVMDSTIQLSASGTVLGDSKKVPQPILRRQDSVENNDQKGKSAVKAYYEHSDFLDSSSVSVH